MNITFSLCCSYVLNLPVIHTISSLYPSPLLVHYLCEWTAFVPCIFTNLTSVLLELFVVALSGTCCLLCSSQGTFLLPSVVLCCILCCLLPKCLYRYNLPKHTAFSSMPFLLFVAIYIVLPFRSIIIPTMSSPFYETDILLFDCIPVLLLSQLCILLPFVLCVCGSPSIIT